VDTKCPIALANTQAALLRIDTTEETKRTGKEDPLPAHTAPIQGPLQKAKTPTGKEKAAKGLEAGPSPTLASPASLLKL
jgi:hypothetical protein